MFTEFLWLKPRIDPGTGRAMEASLTTRFSRVARKFSRGLKGVVTGSLLGFSVGLVARLLNPLNELEEKIKTLLGTGSDTQDFADKFGTSPAKLKRFEIIAHSFGATPEKLHEVLDKFNDKIDEAKKEIQAGGERSQSTRLLAPFIKQKDKLAAFEKFLGDLKASANGPGVDIPVGPFEQEKAKQRKLRGEKLSQEDRANLISKGLLIPLTGKAFQDAIEKEIFGGPLTGGLKDLANGNIKKREGEISRPNILNPGGSLDLPKIEAAFERTKKLNDKANLLGAQNSIDDFIASSQKVTEKMITMIAQGQAADEARKLTELEQFKSFKNAEKALEDTKTFLFKWGTGPTAKAIGDAAAAFNKLDTSGFFKALGKSMYGRGKD